jgi:hypothetical protein
MTSKLMKAGADDALIGRATLDTLDFGDAAPGPKTSGEVWLNLQTAYDLGVAR